MVEDGQVFKTVFRPFGVGIFRKTAPTAGRADKSTNAVCGKRVIVKGEMPLVGAAALYPALFQSAKAAKADAPFRDPALVKTEGTGDAVL